MAPTSKVELADGFEPPLPADSYRIAATQRVTIPGEAVKPFAAEKKIYVAAPRFVLNPGEVYSVYPPAGQVGAFHAALPHIVLSRKTLPWERLPPVPPGEARSEDGKKRPIRAPWMALLTIDDDEIAEHSIELKSVPVRELFADPPADGTWLPELSKEPLDRTDGPVSEQDHCLVARMPAPFFRKIAPALDELRFFAHARKAGPDDKDLADAAADGWFAVVVGNRRPRRFSRSRGLLVSLEGFGEVLKRQRGEDATAGWTDRWVQPPVLHQWSYVCEGRSFQELLEGLTETERGEQKDVWLRPLPDQCVPAGDAERVLKDPAASPGNKALAALTLGYTALSHNLRQGSRTVSWYRGPLIPTPLDPDPQPPVFMSADEALQYDPGTGMFNVSYAAAWQLGRLLALQNLDFATSVLHRSDGYVGRGVLDVAKTALTASDPFEEQAKLLLQDELMVGLLAEWWFSDPADIPGNGGDRS